jgi:hypothetical protein
MTRRHVEVSTDAVARAIRGAQKAGVEIKSVRVEPNGAVVINGDSGDQSEKPVARKVKAYL